MNHPRFSDHSGEEQARRQHEGLRSPPYPLPSCEVKEVKVLLHPVLVRGLGDHDNITLEQEAQGGQWRFCCTFADLGQKR